ncbi:MAG: HAMP domain-containing protein [Planctomycetia bacterium]|nr:HAMP domain-containing protein [Planctomycetia bacterium]
MSYRSFKRVLGETSLERKCRFLFGACLLLLITGSFWWYGKQTEYLVYKQNPDKGRLIVDTVLTRTHWQGLEKNEQFKKIIPALSTDLEEQDFGFRFIGLTDAKLIEKPVDEFERQLIQRFIKGASVDERFSDDGKEYYYYQAIRAQDKCVIVCHRPTADPGGLDSGASVAAMGPLGISYGRPPVAGDLMAVARVDIPNGPTQRDLNLNRAILLSTAIITVFLAMVASWVIVRYVIVKPLKHLRDVSDAVGRGNVEQRAEIHTADEFEELGVAFNRMLRHLMQAQEDLRHVNADLDTKVDELAQMNMRLFEMNRLKSDFLATMSHELRTPLNSIIGFSDVLGAIDSLDERQKRYVLNIQKSGKMLLDMINDILDLAKIESGKMEVRLTDFRIEQAIATQCDMARPLTERKNIDLEVDVAPRLPELHQDQSKVQQILNNLLSNAIKFTPEGGRIVISARRDANGDLLLVVADTGVGIAEEDQVTIFEKFRQGRTALSGGDAMTREFSGTGLGLSIVKELCKLLGGEIALVSELGKGSEFTVRLPWSLPDQVQYATLTGAMPTSDDAPHDEYDRPLPLPESAARP